jgi:hypothetical protein
VLALLEKEQADEEFDLMEAVTELSAQTGWAGILVDALGVLQDVSLAQYWYDAASIIYWGISRTDELPVPKMAVIARLYWCLIKYPSFGDDGENLVWSIASQIKGVGYLSEWDPMTDPEVRKYLAEFDAMG